MQALTNAPTVVLPTVEAIVLSKFSGALSRFQLGAYNDLLEARVAQKVAHKIAMDFGSDLGRLMATDAEFRAKVGKADSHGNSRIAISGGAKIATKRSMSIVRLAQQARQLFDEGLTADCDICENLSAELLDYVKGCEAWVAEQPKWVTVRGAEVS